MADTDTAPVVEDELPDVTAVPPWTRPYLHQLRTQADITLEDLTRFWGDYASERKETPEGHDLGVLTAFQLWIGNDSDSAAKIAQAKAGLPEDAFAFWQIGKKQS